MQTQVVFRVKETTEKELSHKDTAGVVKFEGKALRGTNKMTIFIEQDEAQEFQVGEEYVVEFKLKIQAEGVEKVS